MEFFGQSEEELSGKIERLKTDLEARGLGNYLYRALGAEEQARIWELRRAALGLTMSQTGDAKAISFVEDTAVPPERLRDYIENFQKILAKYDTQAGFYAHASVGLLHIRPVVNLKSVQGVQRFEAIATRWQIWFWNTGARFRANTAMGWYGRPSRKRFSERHCTMRSVR